MSDIKDTDNIEEYDVSLLYDSPSKWMDGFGRNTYESSFADFMKEFGLFFKWLDECYLRGEEDSCLDGNAEKITAAAISRIDSVESKTERERFRMMLNMYTVTYIIPGILKSRHDLAPKQADALCDSWASHFPDSHIKAAGLDQINDGFRRKMCYVTTAVCTGLHKSDACEELKKLKAYRDDYLAKQPDGSEDIDRYYDIAPTIVTRISLSDDPDSEYRYLYTKYIDPCIRFIDKGENEKCRELYSSMVDELSRKYFITNTHDTIAIGGED